MLTVDEALKHVLDKARPQPPINVPLARALGHVLAADVSSDVDSPPHDKSIVDGYAVRSADLLSDVVELDVIEEIVAGDVPRHAVAAGQASRVMTGAPVPPGADAVVMLERTTLLPAESPASTSATVRIESGSFIAGQNIMRQGASMRRGESVLPAGRAIRPIELGVLAEVGCTSVPVVRRPAVAVLATGNELVPAEATPAAGQIRNSNGPMLMALVSKAGAEPIDLGIGRDEEQDLCARMARGLKSDVLVLSGGVSAGVLDLVPGVLADLGVAQVFHKVSLKPGKPLWFGVYARGQQRTLVFGLPGNPVSSLVCFELFVRPAIERLAGRETIGLPRTTMPLAKDFEHRGDRPTYHPSRVVSGAVEPLRWQGSGDLRTLVDATALACFAAGNRQYHAGEPIDILQLI